MATTFSHVAISCRDPIATERVYTRHFGFSRARVIPLGAQQIVFLKAGAVYLEALHRLFTVRDIPALMLNRNAKQHLTVPTLLLGGDRDPVFPPAVGPGKRGPIVR